MLKMHFSYSAPNHCRSGLIRCSARILNYPLKDKLTCTPAGISASKKRTWRSGSFARASNPRLMQKMKSTERGLAVYKRANAIMVWLLICVAPAGFDLAVLSELLAHLSALMHHRLNALRKNVLWQWPSSGLQAKECLWVSHMRGVTLFAPFRIWILMVTFSRRLWFFALFMNVTGCNWPTWPRADATPQTWEVIARLQNTHTHTHTQGWQEKAWEWERGREAGRMRCLRGNKQTWLLKYSH